MPGPLRILLTISDLRGGGAEREFALLAEHLPRARFEPHLCFWRPVFAYAPPPDLPVHLLEKTRPWHLARVVRALRRLIDELRPELIFSQLHYVNMVTGTALARTGHRPGWICRQVNDPRREMRGPFAAWARRALRRADRALGCSAGVSQAMLEHLRLDPARVGTLRNLVDLDRIGRLAAEPLPIPRPPGLFAVVHAGRFCAQKNQELLLDAFAGLRGRPAELWMLGEGPLEGRLRRRARSLGLERQVRWLGFQRNPYPFFRAADCFALSSDHEGLPNALLEAMACGTAVVATRCPYGPEELIRDGVSGRLTPVGDAGALGGALLALCSDRPQAARLGAAGRARVAVEFDTQACCEAYAALFEEVAAARAAAAPAAP